MFKMVKKHKSIFLYITLIAIAIPIIVLVPSKYGIIPLDIGKEIVGYIASIMGGVIGIAGVYVTLNHENEKQSYENKRKALPLLDILRADEYDYKYKYFDLDFLYTEESRKRERKDIPDTASVSISVKNVGYRELYDLYFGDFESTCFYAKHWGYHLSPVLYQDHEIKMNIYFYEHGSYDNDAFKNKYDTIIEPLGFSCYYRDCYDNWYKQDAKIFFIFNLEKDVDIENRALQINFERGEITSAPKEIALQELPWENGKQVCEC